MYLVCKPTDGRKSWQFYSLFRKTVNTRENIWNVYCFATIQMRDETAKDNRQPAAWISHDLIRK